jgi:SAM-dependent methyltransferase
MDFRRKLHPELGVAGFSKLDGTVRFYNFVKAAMAKCSAKRVLDFGAGRGGPLETPIIWRRQLQDLRQLGAEVWASDVDPIVCEHPASHHQVVIDSSKPLPFDDAFFDIIVSDFTFEHITNPTLVSQELLRVLRPGGYICARTANKFGYVTILSSTVPNRLHVKALTAVQPDRLERDVFPTAYKMNTVSQVRSLFGGSEVYWYRDSAEPAYYFGSNLAYRFFSLLHRVLPDVLATSVCFFIKKAGADLANNDIPEGRPPQTLSVKQP